MTDYTKEAEERIYPTYEQSGGGKNWDEMTELEQAYYNLRKAYNAFDVMKNTYLRVRQQSAAEIDRLRGENEKLRNDMLNAVRIEAELRGEVERLTGLLHETWNKQYPHPQYVQDLWQQFKTENNI